MRYPRNTQLNWAAATRSDIEDVSRLLTAIELLDEPAERHSLEQLHERWDSGEIVAADTRLGRDSGGTLVAYAHNATHAGPDGARKVFLMGGVHPGWRRRGIGRAVLEWQLAAAREWHATTAGADGGPLHLYGWADEKLTDRAAAFVGAGLPALRWFADCSLDLAAHPPSPPRVVDGIVLVPYHPRLSEQVRAAHNEAFASEWAAQPVARTDWEEQLAAATFRPQWSWVATVRDSGELVGYALNSAYVEDWGTQGFAEGWTDWLGVRPGWRGQGIAQALLSVSAGTFAREGLDAAGIGVDSAKPDDAFALYRQLGYDTGDVAVMYGRVEAADQVGSAD